MIVETDNLSPMTQNLTSTDANIETALGVSRSILAADWAALDGLLAPDFRYNGDLGEPYTRDQYIGFMQAMKGAMSDMTMDFTHTVAQDDLVSIRFVTKARQTGKFMGAPATKKKVEIRGILMRRIRGGKVVEEWQATDLLWMMTQMGFGTLMGYTIAAGMLHKSAAIPARIA
jgi:predicted ester cyclase